MKNYPNCGQEIENYHEVTFHEPYVHNNPYDGLMIYGAFTAPKENICFVDNFLHFAFYDSAGLLTDHTLVQLGVQNPSTKTPSEEYLEMAGELEEDDEDLSPWYGDDEDDFYDEFDQ